MFTYYKVTYTHSSRRRPLIRHIKGAFVSFFNECVSSKQCAHRLGRSFRHKPHCDRLYRYDALALIPWLMGIYSSAARSSRWCHNTYPKKTTHTQRKITCWALNQQNPPVLDHSIAVIWSDSHIHLYILNVTLKKVSRTKTAQSRTIIAQLLARLTSIIWNATALSYCCCKRARAIYNRLRSRAIAENSQCARAHYWFTFSLNWKRPFTSPKFNP